MKKGSLKSPFKDAAYSAEKSPAQSTIGLTGDNGMNLVIGLEIGGAPADALDYIKSISK